MFRCPIDLMATPQVMKGIHTTDLRRVSGLLCRPFVAAAEDFFVVCVRGGGGGERGRVLLGRRFGIPLLGDVVNLGMFS